MGYELRMYIVTKHNCMGIGSLALIDDKIYSVYDSESKTGKKQGKKIYYPDGNTKKIVPVDVRMIEQKGWCQVIAMIDLCNCGYAFSDIGICDFEDSDGLYMYTGFGDDIVGLDSYGSYRKFVPISIIIDQLKEAVKEDGYRRFKVALETIVSIQKEFKGEDVGCLFYGY